MTRSAKFLVVLLGFAMASAACTSSDQADDQTSPPTPEDAPDDAPDDLLFASDLPTEPLEGEATIGVAMQNLDRTFFTGLESGARTQADQLGAELIVTDANDDSAKQLEDVAALLAADVDGIILSPVDSEAAVEIAQLAADAGVPLLAVANQVGSVDRYGPQYVHPLTMGLVTNDDVAMGRRAAELTAVVIEDEARIAVVEGKLGTANAAMRNSGFVEGLDNLGVEHEIVASAPGDWTGDGGRAVCADFATLDINVVFSMSDAMTAGCAEAMADANRDDVKIVSIGGNAAGIELLTEGRIEGTVCQKPGTMGALAVEVMVDALNTAKFERGLRFYETPTVTADRLGDCDPQW